jgi:hypothetical protein
MRRAAPAAVAVALVALALAGCGSQSLSDRDLRADATQLCNVARFRTNRISRPRSPAAGLAYLRRGVSVLAPELAALRRLGPPGDLAKNYDGTLAAFASTVRALRTAIAGLRAGAAPVGAYQALERQLAPLVAQENASWQGLQIPACVNR